MGTKPNFDHAPKSDNLSALEQKVDDGRLLDLLALGTNVTTWPPTALKPVRRPNPIVDFQTCEEHAFRRLPNRPNGRNHGCLGLAKELRLVGCCRQVVFINSQLSSDSVGYVYVEWTWETLSQRVTNSERCLTVVPCRPSNLKVQKLSCGANKTSNSSSSSTSHRFQEPDLWAEPRRLLNTTWSLVATAKIFQ